MDAEGAYLGPKLFSLDLQTMTSAVVVVALFLWSAITLLISTNNNIGPEQQGLLAAGFRGCLAPGTGLLLFCVCCSVLKQWATQSGLGGQLKSQDLKLGSLVACFKTETFSHSAFFLSYTSALDCTHWAVLNHKVIFKDVFFCSKIHQKYHYHKKTPTKTSFFLHACS